MGCATPYKSIGFMGGYSESQLASDVFRVYFRGNAKTSGERAQDFALLRAADLTLQRGFGFFAIIDESFSTSVSTLTTPGTAQTTGSGQVSGNSLTYSASTIYTPPMTDFVFKPQAALFIRCFNEKPEGIYAFDAEFVQQSLKQKYGIK